MSDKTKIIVRVPNWIGDAVLATAFLAELRRMYKDSIIDILAVNWVAPVFDNNPDIDGIIIYNRKINRGIVGMLKEAIKLRKMGYEIAYIIPDSFSSALIFLFAGIKKRIGYKGDMRGFMLTQSLKNPGRTIHRLKKYINLLGLVRRKKIRTRLFISKKERKSVNKLIKRNDLNIGVNPTSKAASRRWFPDRYRELLKLILNGKNTNVYIFGAPEDMEYNNNICVGLGKSCKNLAGKTNLRESMAAISEMDIFITNESGLMHVASALNIPILVINGAADTNETGPTSDNYSMIVQAGIDCQPCVKNECILRNYECFERLNVKMVYFKYEKLLAKLKKD